MGDIDVNGNMFTIVEGSEPAGGAQANRHFHGPDTICTFSTRQAGELRLLSQC